MRPVLSHLYIVSLILLLAACGGIEKEAKYPTGADRALTGTNDIYSEPESIFGEGGLKLFDGRSDNDDTGTSGIGVNSFLWRASLDTVSFMPLSSADPFGGVILTDWYMPDDKGKERFKVNVFILDRKLRSDALRVRTFKQVRSGGTWKDVAVADGTDTQLEDAILTRARQLRVDQIARTQD